MKMQVLFCCALVTLAVVVAADPEYFSKYSSFASFYRDDETGILQMTLATDGGPLEFPGEIVLNVHKALIDISLDTNNTVLIVRGSDTNFTQPLPKLGPLSLALISPSLAFPFATATVRNLQAWANVPIPVIFAVQGAYTIHTDYALIGADIILITEDTFFQDAGHILGGIPPGDGIYELYEYAMGPFKAKQFHWLSQTIGAQELKELGIVYKIVPREMIMDEAYSIAQKLLELNSLTRINTRSITQTTVKRLVEAYQPQNVVLELFAVLDVFRDSV
eukprot:TRINITY_DN5957_c0_g1_i2.p2 TRINITY_DN5957_c0_g1~~TRINITY_DN5957_c0_g1_i2.p2  ORF type:complete len:277 (+),score=26.24 TRINITY_DN5957_c0_g1_i2:94-924(+)